MQPDISVFPELVRFNTALIREDTYTAYCEQWSSGGATVHYHFVADYDSSFWHEMGHATAHILGIEEELGRLVMKQPNAQSETNENPFCYGAQRLARHDFHTALAEYAADAIRMYYLEPDELPAPVLLYLSSKLGDDHAG